MSSFEKQSAPDWTTQTYLHSQDSRRHLGGAEAAQEVVQHLAGGLLVRCGPQQEVLQTSQQLPLLLLSLWGEERGSEDVVFEKKTFILKKDFRAQCCALADFRY